MFAIIDMDNMVFLGTAKNYQDIRIIEETLCKDRNEPLICPMIEQKSDWSALTELEAMLLGNKYELDVVMGDYVGNLDKIRVYAAGLAPIEITREQLELFNAPAKALQDKYGSQETRPTASRMIVEKPKKESQPIIRPQSPKGATGRVWEIADKVLAEVGSDNLKNLRMAVIQACIDCEIHPATAATQWSRWKKDKGL